MILPARRSILQHGLLCKALPDLIRPQSRQRYRCSLHGRLRIIRRIQLTDKRQHIRHFPFQAAFFFLRQGEFGQFRRIADVHPLRHSDFPPADRSFLFYFTMKRRKRQIIARKKASKDAFALLAGKAILFLAGNLQRADIHRGAADAAAEELQVATHGNDVLQHVVEIACHGDLLHRTAALAALDDEALGQE